jgi:hypothetical protein
VEVVGRIDREYQSNYSFSATKSAFKPEYVTVKSEINWVDVNTSTSNFDRRHFTVGVFQLEPTFKYAAKLHSNEPSAPVNLVAK